jgi:glucose/arabinose dehydrogenase
VAEVLVDLGGVDRGNEIVLRDPKVRDFMDALAQLSARVAAGRRAVAQAGGRTEVLFYYSGHADEKGLLLGEDRVSYQSLRDRLDEIPTDVRIAVLDACASGAFTRIGSLAVCNGYLYISIGERESGSRVQDLSTHVSKTLRIHDDGRVPSDHPLVGGTGTRPVIWTWGHRNPTGLAFDANGTLWTNEHGPRHGDELNPLEPGRDSGWPRVSFGWNCTGGAVSDGLPTGKQTTAPMWVWTPAIAPSDMAIYSGDAFPAWRGIQQHVSQQSTPRNRRLAQGVGFRPAAAVTRRNSGSIRRAAKAGWTRAKPASGSRAARARVSSSRAWPAWPRRA